MAKVKFDLLHVDRIPSYRRTAGNVSALARSIAAEGLQVPLLVRPVRSRAGGKDLTTYDVVDGRHRYEAIVEVRKSDPKAFDEVEVKLYEGNETDALVMGFITNDQRHNHGPLDEADFLRMMTQRGHKLGEVAKRCGISSSRASRVLAVRNAAPEEMLAAIDAGRFPFSIADQWVRDGWSESKLLAGLQKYLAAAETGEQKGRKKRAAKEAGVVRVMGVKPLTLLHTFSQKLPQTDHYWAGLSDGLAVALQLKEPPSELTQLLEQGKEPEGESE